MADKLNGWCLMQSGGTLRVVEADKAPHHGTNADGKYYVSHGRYDTKEAAEKMLARLQKQCGPAQEGDWK